MSYMFAQYDNMFISCLFVYNYNIYIYISAADYAADFEVFYTKMAACQCSKSNYTCHPFHCRGFSLKLGFSSCSLASSTFRFKPFSLTFGFESCTDGRLGEQTIFNHPLHP